MTIEARWNGKTIARSDETVVVEGNHYFPRGDVEESLLEPSAKSTFCPWKGDASYFSVTVDGRTNPDAAWTYSDPKPDAEHIRDRLAFWNGVEVVEV